MKTALAKANPPLQALPSLRIVVIAPELVINDPTDAYAIRQTERSRSLRIGLLENGFNLVAVLPADTFLNERLIELVGQDESDLQAARTRWKHYKDRGYALSRYDVVSKAQTTH